MEKKRKRKASLRLPTTKNLPCNTIRMDDDDDDDDDDCLSPSLSPSLPCGAESTRDSVAAADPPPLTH